MVLTKSEFLAVVSEEQRRAILECVIGGFEDYKSPEYYSDKARIEHKSGTRASCRNDHIVARAQRMSLEIMGIRAITKRGRVLFLVGENRAVVAFKKFDKNLRPRQSRTRQGQDLLNQNLLFNLPEQPTAVIAGYRLKNLDMDCEVFIVCPDGEGHSWQLQLFGEDVPSFFLADQDTLASNDGIRRRIVIKDEEEKKNAADGAGR